MVMKACLVLQNQYAKLGHAIALYLKEHHGVNDFCGYIFSPGAKEFITTQRDIKYEPILVDHELHAGYAKETTNLDYIKHFEKTYSPPHLWHYFYSDRKLMMSIGPKEETTTVIDPLYPHEDLLKIFQIRAQAIEKMLREAQPDFILFFAIGTLAHLILFHVAKKLGLRTYNLDFPRIGNLISLSENYNTLSGVETVFTELQKTNQIIPEHQQADDFMARFAKTGSLDLEYLEVDVAVNPANSDSLKPKSLTQTLRYLITLTKNYRKNHGLFLYGMTDQNPLRFIGHKTKQRYRKLRGIDDLYTEPGNEDFAFYPLHYEPELSTLLLSHFYFDQVALIRHIARSLPLHFKLYVKEHPAMVYKRSRSYYKELLTVPNVRLVSHKSPSAELIKRARLVTVITGTVGWEACLLRKPVISFGEVFYNALSFVKRVRNLETLPSVIQEQLEHFAYNQNEMRNFVAAAFKDAVAFNFAGLWYEEDVNKLKHNPDVRNLADCLIRKHQASQLH